MARRPNANTIVAIAPAKLRWAMVLATMMMLQFLHGPSSCFGQFLNYAQQGEPEDPGLELLQEDPHDIIFFSDEAGGGWAKVQLLDFPGRTPPTAPSGNLRFKVLGYEKVDLQAKWKEIQRIDLWEVRLERETQERIRTGDFVGAYPFLSVLIRDFPERAGLRELRSEFLWNDSIARARRGELSSTLTMLEELRSYAPGFKKTNVLGAMSRIADRLIAKLVDDGDLERGRELLRRLEKEYQNDRLPVVTKWNERFLAMAKDRQDRAVAALEQKKFAEARRLIRESVFVEPKLEGNPELLEKIQTIYPIINVGVLQSAKGSDPTRIDNWAARRSGRLLYRTLFEIQEVGPEGGEYDFLFGETSSTPDRRSFTLELQRGNLTPPFDTISSTFLADVMTNRARPDSPDYFAPWAAAVRSIGLDGPTRISFDLRRPHILPISLLRIPVDGEWFGGDPGSPTGDYRRDLVEDDASVVRYRLVDDPKTEDQPREIVELRLESGSDGARRLIRGELDVVDQLFPADAILLKGRRDIRVVNYPLPTVHMLVPCSDHPFVAERIFRRALLYGINRQDILNGELLAGKEFEGCKVLSGPFPAGIELDDPLGYAYDQSITPRPYEPPLAKLLLAMNQNQMKATADRKKEKVPELTPLRLAFPADNLSRVACEAIRSQWELLGLEVELVEMPVGQTFPDDDQDLADLVYVAAAVWEPFIDARRVLGPEGLAKSNDQLVGLGLRRIEEAINWPGVRDGLITLHSIAHHELPILPLWQMVDSYAYRRDLKGIGRDIVSLYQNAERWRLTK